MKFMYFLLPTLPATLEERLRLRPLAMHPERWQRMLADVVEISQLAEDVGFEAVSFPEHHLHSCPCLVPPETLNQYQLE
jgi:alkanesulfonate monooxygenase SsuD/methylene tetrahydromethanopterin reductase-like flavin-dependent oxidoreductase (luciferase family)